MAGRREGGMTEKQIAQDGMYLVSCALNSQIPDQARVDAMDLDAVYLFAARHMILATVAFALESAGCGDERTRIVIAAAQRKAVLFQHELSCVTKELEKQGIWYVLLKGAALQHDYPTFGMREMGDYDILIDADRAADVKTIMEGLGFTKHRLSSSNHDVYHKEPVLSFEMHRTLFGPEHDPKLYGYYKSIHQRLLGDGCKKHFSPEDFYLYLLAHEYMHYCSGGTGLRSLMDTYVYLNKETLDMRYVAAEAEKLGIRMFEAQNRSLALHLFGAGDLTGADQSMLEYMLSSGVFGTIEHKVSNKMRQRQWTAPQYMLHRFFVPFSKKNREYDVYAGVYPFFYQHRLLLPLLRKHPLKKKSPRKFPLKKRLRPRKPLLSL